jgi:N-acetylneuraminic acid mutarotase
LFLSERIQAAVLCLVYGLACSSNNGDTKGEVCVERRDAVGQWLPIPDGMGIGGEETVVGWVDGELIVWGGSTCAFACAKGARFEPATNEWSPMSSDGATARAMAAGIWAGRRLIVWGGVGNSETLTAGHPMLNTGDVYDLDDDSWSALSQSTPPPPRARHQAFLVGPDKMVIWGGVSANAAGETFGEFLSDGAVFDLDEGSWTMIPEEGAPKTIFASIVSANGELIVWGGVDPETRAPSTSGARFDPVTMAWRTMTQVDAPAAQQGPAVWTGTEFLIWGGVESAGGEEQGPGGAYDPRSDSWRPISTHGAPVLIGAAAVWNGRYVLVWGGDRTCPEGGVYDPATDQWRSTTLVGAPTPRARSRVVAADGDLIVFGGLVGEGGQIPAYDGARFVLDGTP